LAAIDEPRAAVATPTAALGTPTASIVAPREAQSESRGSLVTSRAALATSSDRVAAARASLAAPTDALGSANEPRQHPDQTVDDRRDAIGVRLLRHAAEHRDLHRRRGFDRLAARNRECASFVRASDPSRPLGDIEASALGRAKSLVTEVAVPNASVANGDKELSRDAKRDELVMREKRFVEHVDCPFAPAKDNPTSDQTPTRHQERHSQTRLHGQ